MDGGKKTPGLLKRLTECDPAGSHIEIFGNRLICVEGCQGVLNYSEEAVKLSLGSRGMRVLGHSLKITGMFGSTVRIEGHVLNVEFF